MQYFLEIARWNIHAPFPNSILENNFEFLDVGR